MIHYPIVILLFLLNFLVDAEPKYSKYPKVIKYVLNMYYFFQYHVSEIKYYNSMLYIVFAG